MRLAGALLLALVLSAPAGSGAESPASPSPSPVAIAEMMRQVRYSDGFAVRMNVTVVTPTGQRSLPIKLAVVGQIDPARGRLLIRGISPDPVRNRFIAAERSGDGPVRALAYRAPPTVGSTAIDPFARLFDSDFTVWDLFAPWWNWPEQRLAGTGRVGEDDCVNIRSHTAVPAGAGTGPIREVVSCVDQDRRLSLRTQLFDDRHALVRTLVVDETMRRASGRFAARRLSITGADQAVTEVEVYSGDEDYSVPADTFAALDAAAGGNSVNSR